MKLHAHKEHIDYHPIARYVKVLIDCGRTRLKRVVSFCTASGEYECYADPLRTNAEGELEMIKGQSDSLTFEIDAKAPSEIVNSWYDREITQRSLNEYRRTRRHPEGIPVHDR